MPVKRRDLIAVFLMAVFFISILTAGATQTQKPDPLLGTWDVKTEEGGREFVFEFSLKDGKLAGKFIGASGTSEMANLTFVDNTVKFSVTVGNGMVIDFSGPRSSDSASATGSEIQLVSIPAGIEHPPARPSPPGLHLQN